MVRLRALVVLPLVVCGSAATPAVAAEPVVTLTASSPVTWWGSSVRVKVTANQPGRVWLAQSRRYVIETPGTGTCGSYDKYVGDTYGLHGDYLPERNPSVLEGHPVGPGQPYSFTLPGSVLAFGAGKRGWETGDTWPGCRTKYTPYDRLTAYYASDAGGQPGGSYFSDTEKRVALTRLF